MRRLFSLLVLLGLASTTACGTGAADFDMSVRRVALSLAFADEDKAEPLQPRVIVRMIPAPPDALIASAPTIPLALPAKCPTAPPGASVVDVGTYGIQLPPASGTYLRHNEGNLTIKGALDIRLPFPRLTRWEVSEMTPVDPPAVTDDPAAPAAGADNVLDNFPTGETEGAPMWEYTVRKVLTPEFTITDTYRLTSRRVLLLKRETTTADGTITFTPDPPLTMLEHADGEGHHWRSASVDESTGTAMVVDGLVEKREPVDLCGEMHDALRIVVTERMVNLATGETSGTDDADPNVYYVATQLGGLVLREDVHFTQTIATAEGQAIVVWDYQSTQSSATPEPAR